MWEPDFWRDIVLIGIGTGAILFAEHYALDHWRAAFLKYPPRAYSVGVSTLFGGYIVWAGLHPSPLPPLTVVGALFGLTLLAGTGTWAANTLHNWQRRRAKATTRAVW